MASPMVVNVMLAVHEKKTAAVDLYRPLRQYIATTFSEREAQANEDDLQAVRQMRSDLENPSPTAPSPELRRDLLQHYFRALALIEPRFPISPDRSHVHSFVFTWHDAFKPNKKVSLPSIHLEKAAVLFNLAAVYSQIALSADRSSPAGLKQACNSFQAAAGSFAFLRDQAAAKAAAAGATLDLSPECTSMLERLMLAQAQECFFEKVIADAKPPGLCSKVARQVGLYYEEAYAAITGPPLNQHFDRTWVSHVQLKAAQFYAEACYRYSLELHEKEEIAEEIARLKIGLGALTDAKKSAKGVAQPLIDAVSRLESNMNRNLERATKENDRVYLMRVPAAGSLSALPGASLVKSTAMGEVLDANKERLFSGLVPDSSTKALSKYTEMVDDIIRTQAEKLQQGSEITRVKLKEMDLPDSILALEGNISLPMDLKEDIEAVQISGGPSGLEAELQQIRDLRRVNQELLVQTEELLQKEANEDTQFRTQFGTRWTRPQSSTLTKNLQERLNRFAANLKQASDSDTRIERAVKDNAALMAILDRKPIESALPSLARPIMSLDGNEDAIVGALKQSLDDILPKLMASTGSHEDLFKKEIAKYDQICEEIAQNIEAQEQLLLQIQDAITNIKQQCSDFVMTRNIQCREMIEDVQRQIAGLNFTADGKTGYNYPMAGQSNSQRNAPQQPEPQSAPPPSHPQPPYHRPSGDQPRPGYSQPYPAYATPQPPPYYASGSHYQQPQQPPSHEYGQPAYPGWRGPYYNTHQQQPGSHPPPPYTVPGPYPSQQGSYYRPQ
ncbi:Vacuolar-sorting protein BRO1 [Cocos nucifera]|nr:Vacuolar-sorting protein BRO1 [Cocos nucifera]